MAAVDGHCIDCGECAALARGEQRFRLLLRRQPRETAPAEVRDHILTRVRHDARARGVRRWTIVATAAALVGGIMLLAPAPRTSPLVGQLVDTHIAYAQLDTPAEFVSSDRAVVGEWFSRRAGMRVTVPDYSAAGIRLIGARITQAGERKAAYLLYEKGMTLLSVFIAPAGSRADARQPGRVITYRGQQYGTWEHKGYRTIAWTDHYALYGLVSMLDYEALLECADRLRVERLDQMRL